MVKAYLFLAVVDQILADIHNNIKILPEMEVILQSRKHLLLLRVYAVLGAEEIDKLRVEVIWIILISITSSSKCYILTYIEGSTLFNQLLNESSEVTNLFVNEKFEIV